MLLTTERPQTMSSAAIAALGLGQLVNWGVLYYAFAVLLQPVQTELGQPAWLVTGAFSLALLVSALVAPMVGRWSDRGLAPRAIVLGGLGAATLLGVWAWQPGLLTLYLVWAGLGVCMAAALYEPAFAIVTRAHTAAGHRLRALAVVTVFGGLASTVFLPLTAGLVAWAGWRGAVMALALLLVASAALAGFGLRSASDNAAGAESRFHAFIVSAETVRRMRALSVVFGVASFASASFVANLVPALGERGVSPTAAALLGGLFGVMQLPGRAWLVSRRVTFSADLLVAISLALQALGLLVVALVPTRAAVAVGVMAFAVGSGLTTLARPYVVQARFALEQSGLANGTLARAQQLSRAVGPIAASAAAGLSNHVTVLVVLGLVLAVLAWRMSATGAAATP